MAVTDPGTLPPPGTPTPAVDPTWAVNPDGTVGPGRVTTLDTPADLQREIIDAFGSDAFKRTTSAAMLNEVGLPLATPSADPRSDPAATAAMAAAVGAGVLPTPTIDPSAVPPTTPPQPPAGAPPASEAITEPVAVLPSPATQTPLGEGLPPPEPTAEPIPQSAPVSGYDYTFVNPQTGQPETRHLSDVEIGQAVGLASWANSRPDGVKAAMAAIDMGQAVAIPRADYDAYNAWARTRADGRGGGVGPTSSGPSAVDLSALDPDTAQAVQALQQQTAYLEQQLRAQQEQQITQQAMSVADQNMAGKAQAYDQAAREYAAQRGLSEIELGAIVETAVQTGIVPVTEAKYTQLNPITNQPFAMADPYQVIFESLDYALWQNPALYQSVAAREHAQQTAPSTSQSASGVATPVPPSQQFQGYPTTPSPAPAPTVNGGASTPLTPTPAPFDPIALKKANAASMATAPSASVTPTPFDVTKLSREQTAEAMAGDIARYWAGQ